MMQITVQVHIFLSTAVLITGILSCYAFGPRIEEIILYNLPKREAFTILTQAFYMLNIMGTFVMMAQVIFVLVEKNYPDMSALAFYLYRVSFVLAVFVMTILVPNVNVVLSLFAGSICSCALLILPVVFWRKAYLTDEPVKPEKELKQERLIKLGWIVIVISGSISLMGIIQNIRKYGEEL